MPATPAANAPPEAPAGQARPWRIFRRTLVHFDRSKVDLARGARNSIGVATPLIIGAAIGRIQPALVAATGALNVGFADSTDAHPLRVRRMLAASLLVSLAVFCGCSCGWTTPGALAVTALWSFGAGLLVALGAQPGNLGVSSTCILLVFLSRPLPLREAALCGLLALAGGLFQTLLSAVPWAGRTYEAERLALASLYESLARLCGQPSSATAPPPATGRATAAREAIGARQGDHSAATERYRALLDQAERIRVCLITLGALRSRLEPGGDTKPSQSSGVSPNKVAVPLDQYLAVAARILDAAAEMLRTGRPTERDSAPLADAERFLDTVRELPGNCEPGTLLSDIRVQMDALTRQLRVIFDLANHATPAGSLAYAAREAALPWHLRAGGGINTLRANLNLRSTAFRHALRLSVCVAAAEGLGHLLGWYRPYWLPLTAAVVLKPDFASTYSRGVLRLAGTFAGLGIATALFHLLPQAPWVEIGLIVVTTLVLRWTGPAHYGVLAMSVSELVVLLVALTGLAPGPVIFARARNTALGGALALLAYWLWPTWERTQIGEIFARMLDAYSRHFRLTTRAFSDDSAELETGLERTRTNARLSRTNFEASVDRLSAEPGTTALELDRWQAILASSYIFAHSAMMLHASLVAEPAALRALGKNPAFQEFTQQVSRALELLAALARGAAVDPQASPNLRDAHYQLVHSGEPMAARQSLIGVELDRMVNSVNTMREQLLRAAPRKD
jgi:uncharacterized membrane protein YccC